MNEAATCSDEIAFVREWSLSDRSIIADPARTPVRGDLAHIRMAGQHFVPHYAVPVAHFADISGATVRSAANVEADVRDQLEPGTRFAVLDFTGNWAWGQVEREGDNGLGFVGYVERTQIEQAVA